MLCIITIPVAIPIIIATHYFVNILSTAVGSIDKIKYLNIILSRIRYTFK